MRLIPALTAIVVTGVLYVAVFEREALVAFARGEDVGSAEEAGAETDLVDVNGEAMKEAARNAVGVVAVRSVAKEIDNAVVLRGQTQADRQVEVRAETSAIVVSEPLRKGRFVEAGEVLCRLDPGTREATLSESQARLAEAETRVPEARAMLQQAMAQLSEAQINDNAAVRLSADGFASETRVAATQAAVRSAEAGVESARSGLEAARAGIQSAQATLAAAQKEIDRLTIRAPFAGLLESDTAELGSLVQAGSLCATVIQLNPIKLVGYVPETEVNRVEIGALAGARLAAGTQVRGRVTFLSRSADPTTRTFLVEIAVPNEDLTIRDGQTADILIGAEGEMAHFLPQSALTLNKEGRLGLRLVGEDSRVEFVPVTMLRDTMEGVWLSGLPEEADVIVVGQDFVTEGVLVKATMREARE